MGEMSLGMGALRPALGGRVRLAEAFLRALSAARSGVLVGAVLRATLGVDLPVVLVGVMVLRMVLAAVFVGVDLEVLVLEEAALRLLCHCFDRGLRSTC